MQAADFLGDETSISTVSRHASEHLFLPYITGEGNVVNNAVPKVCITNHTSGIVNFLYIVMTWADINPSMLPHSHAFRKESCVCHNTNLCNAGIDLQV